MKNSYDKKGNLVTSEENKGTFDFKPPTKNILDPIESAKSLFNHYTIDVKPWLMWGNSPKDSTTYKERQQTLK
ncbi:hypothetical protein KKA33_01905 [Patescibacteria group bacterium]|nr:hypothetical protein [Patescibacteria group bacterium]